jgi:nitrite reductase/ring-hydroxylating ferredoxin subunit
MIHENTRVTSIEAQTRQARIETAGGPTVRARSVVVATNTPVSERIAVHTKQAAYRTYVIAGRVPRGSIPAFLLWDTDDPYHYVRVQSDRSTDHDLLLVGGEDHKTGQPPPDDAPYARLTDWMHQRFPMVEAVEYRWSGQVLEPVDGLAFIGRSPSDPETVFLATGDSGNGMTHGTIAGMLLTDLIRGRENPWATLYSPTRKSLRAALRFMRENLNVAAQYTDRLTGGLVESVDEIGCDAGAVMRRGSKKIAVHRDAEGMLHERSAVCPHLGCVVAWNDREKTWDCPCHGSRFGPDGHVINGPALSGLSPVERAEAPA